MSCSLIKQRVVISYSVDALFSQIRKEEIEKANSVCLASSDATLYFRVNVCLRSTTETSTWT